MKVVMIVAILILLTGCCPPMVILPPADDPGWEDGTAFTHVDLYGIACKQNNYCVDEWKLYFQYLQWVQKGYPPDESPFRKRKD